MIKIKGDGTDGGSGFDKYAIHVNEVAEIAGISIKPYPTGDDLLVIENASLSYRKESIRISSLPSGGGGEDNVGQNIGDAGYGLYAGKSGLALDFKNLSIGSSMMSIVDDTVGHNIVFDIVPSEISIDVLGDGVVFRKYTQVERIKLDGIEDGADRTDVENVTAALVSIPVSAHIDIVSPGADIEDAVLKRHVQGTDVKQGIQEQVLDMGGFKIVDTADPSDLQDVATKAYVDSHSEEHAIHWDGLDEINQAPYRFDVSGLEYILLEDNYDEEEEEPVPRSKYKVMVADLIKSGPDTDTTAIHVTKPLEIIGIQIKEYLDADDVFVIENSADDEYIKGHVRWDLISAPRPNADSMAFHSNESLEYSDLPVKDIPDDGDLISIEDSGDIFTKKRITVGSLPGGGGANSDTKAIHVNRSDEFNVITESTVGDLEDYVIIEAENSGDDPFRSKRKLKLRNLPAAEGGTAIHWDGRLEYINSEYTFEPLDSTYVLLETAGDGHKQYCKISDLPSSSGGVLGAYNLPIDPDDIWKPKYKVYFYENKTGNTLNFRGLGSLGYAIKLQKIPHDEGDFISISFNASAVLIKHFETDEDHRLVTDEQVGKWEGYNAKIIAGGIAAGAAMALATWNRVSITMMNIKSALLSARVSRNEFLIARASEQIVRNAQSIARNMDSINDNLQRIAANSFNINANLNRIALLIDALDTLGEIVDVHAELIDEHTVSIDERVFDGVVATNGNIFEKPIFQGSYIDNNNKKIMGFLHLYPGKNVALTYRKNAQNNNIGISIQSTPNYEDVGGYSSIVKEISVDKKLCFRTIQPGTAMRVVLYNDVIVLEPKVIRSVGTGTSVYKGISQDHPTLRKIRGGDNVTVGIDPNYPNSITVSSQGGGNALVSIGDGIPIFKGVHNNLSQIKSITAGRGINISQSPALDKIVVAQGDLEINIQNTYPGVVDNIGFFLEEDEGTEWFKCLIGPFSDYWDDHLVNVRDNVILPIIDCNVGMITGVGVKHCLREDFLNSKNSTIRWSEHEGHKGIEIPYFSGADDPNIADGGQRITMFRTPEGNIILKPVYPRMRTAGPIPVDYTNVELLSAISYDGTDTTGLKGGFADITQARVVAAKGLEVKIIDDCAAFSSLIQFDDVNHKNSHEYIRLGHWTGTHPTHPELNRPNHWQIRPMAQSITGYIPRYQQLALMRRPRNNYSNNIGVASLIGRTQPSQKWESSHECVPILSHGPQFNLTNAFLQYEVHSFLQDKKVSGPKKVLLFFQKKAFELFISSAKVIALGVVEEKVDEIMKGDHNLGSTPINCFYDLIGTWDLDYYETGEYPPTLYFRYISIKNTTADSIISIVKKTTEYDEDTIEITIDPLQIHRLGHLAQSLEMNGNQIRNLGQGTVFNDAARMDQILANPMVTYLDMDGHQIKQLAPGIEDSDAVRMDQAVRNPLTKDLDMQDHKIMNLSPGTEFDDAVILNQVITNPILSILDMNEFKIKRLNDGVDHDDAVNLSQVTSLPLQTKSWEFSSTGNFSIFNVKKGIHGTSDVSTMENLEELPYQNSSWTFSEHSDFSIRNVARGADGQSDVATMENLEELPKQITSWSFSKIFNPDGTPALKIRGIRLGDKGTYDVANMKNLEGLPEQLHDWQFSDGSYRIMNVLSGRENYNEDVATMDNISLLKEDMHTLPYQTGDWTFSGGGSYGISNVKRGRSNELEDVATMANLGVLKEEIQSIIEDSLLDIMKRVSALEV